MPESEVWCVEAPLAVLKIDSWHFPVNLWPSYRHECLHFVYGGTCLQHHEQGFVSFALKSNVLFWFLLFTRGKQTKHGSTLRSSNLKQANTAYAQTLI